MSIVCEWRRERLLSFDAPRKQYSRRPSRFEMQDCSQCARGKRVSEFRERGTCAEKRSQSTETPPPNQFFFNAVRIF